MANLSAPVAAAYNPAIMTEASPATRPVAGRTGRIAFAALLAGALAIAFAPIFVRLSAVGPVATAFWRVTLAVPVLMVWMNAGVSGGRALRRPQTVRDHVRLALAGVFFAGDLAVWHWSIKFTSVANATLLANFAPIFVTLASWLLFGERFSRGFIAGLVVAMTGCLVLMGDSFSLSFEHLFGDALGIVTAAFYAAYIVAVGRLRAEFATATIMTYSSAVTGPTDAAQPWWRVFVGCDTRRRRLGASDAGEETLELF